MESVNWVGRKLQHIGELACDDRTKVKTLTIEMNDVDSFIGVEEFINLQNLNVSRNKIQSIASITQMAALQSLFASFNLIELWPVVSSLDRLEMIDLSHNRLRIMSGFSGLKKLTWLNLSNNHISDIKEMNSGSILQYLNLSHNSLSSTSKRSLEIFKELNELNLSSNSLTSISILEYCPTLETVDFSHNSVKDISLERSFKSSVLTSLNLGSNCIKDVDAIPAHFPSLTFLDLSYCQITKFGNLKKWSRLRLLTDLSIVGNPFALDLESAALMILKKVEFLESVDGFQRAAHDKKSGELDDTVARSEVGGIEFDDELTGLFTQSKNQITDNSNQLKEIESSLKLMTDRLTLKHFEAIQESSENIRYCNNVLNTDISLTTDNPLKPINQISDNEINLKTTTEPKETLDLAENSVKSGNRLNRSGSIIKSSMRRGETAEQRKSNMESQFKIKTIKQSLRMNSRLIPTQLKAQNEALRQLFKNN